MVKFTISNLAIDLQFLWKVSQNTESKIDQLYIFSTLSQKIDISYSIFLVMLHWQ